jgi:acetyltransferase
MLDWAQAQGVGFSTIVTLGPHTSPALDLPQVLDFLASDNHTQSILVYLEGIRNARRFMSALRAAAYAKPVVVMKAGRQASGSTVALTHSAAIVGADDVFDAALRRAGVVRVRQFTQLFSAAQCLASRFRPVGQSLAIVSNGGGPSVLAADAADALGLKVAGVEDLGEDADGSHYVQAMQAAMARPEVDGVLLINAPKAGVDANSVALPVAQAFAPRSKPVIGCWLGEASARGARQLLVARGMPVFRTPEAAVDAFNNIASFHRNQQLLQQTPPPLGGGPAPDTEGARLLIEAVLAERRKVLTEMESKALLAAFHIPVTRTMLARSANEAMLIASQLGFPVALKIDSPDILHKSDYLASPDGTPGAGGSGMAGVVLDVNTAAQVRDRYQELIQAVHRARPNAVINGVSVQPMAGRQRGREVYLGLSTDAAFGPVITFGAGGTMIELFNDRAIELPPLNVFLAQRLSSEPASPPLLGPLARRAGGQPGGVGSAAAARQRDGGRAAAAARDGHQPGHRRRARRSGGRRAHRRRRDRLGLVALWPPGDPALPQRPGACLADEGWRRLHDAADPPRRRRHAAGAGARVVAAKPLLPLCQHVARAADAHAGPLHAHRLRPRDGAGGGGQVAGSGRRPPQAGERIVGVSRLVTNADGTSCEFALVVADDSPAAASARG